jgi:glycosyltransferase involved in cell wall biosynthesis
MNTPVVCTIVAKNYLAQARCLVDSFLEHHPGGRAFVLLVDRPDGYFDPAQERFTTVLVEELDIPDFRALSFRYTVLELSTAVKPFFLEYLFANYDYDKLCYLDPDIYFYRAIDTIWEKLDSYAIVLVPHLLGELDEEFLPNELTILRAGAYNLGFLGLSRHEQTEQFLRWWQAKMSKYCFVAFDQGLFVDQRWVDLVPARFSSTYIHRDPGCDVAYWDLYNRHIERQGDAYTVNGAPLKFYHFSGFSPDHPERISKHQNRYTFQDLPLLKELFDGYCESLRARGYDTVKQWPYAYSSQNSMGVRIPDIANTLWQAYEASAPSQGGLSDVASRDQYITELLHWLNEPLVKGPPLITRLAMDVYQRRPDLQRAFPEVPGPHQLEYARWFLNWGRSELGIDEFFVQDMHASLSSYMRSRALLAQRGVVAGLYQALTDLLFRIGLGRHIERLLGERIVGRVRSFFVRSGAVVPPRPRAKTSASRGLRRGVNVVGYLRDETGVGENARAAMRALHSQGFPLAWTMVSSPTGRKNDQSVLHLPQGNPYNVNLLYVNADQIPVVYDELGAEFFEGKYNIACWAWELERFPEAWRDRFDYLDEIWVISRFMQDTLAHVAPIPVVNMGVGIDKQPLPGASRSALGLPEDKFIFLFTFDMLSFIQRKNPWGAIQAYQRAFGPDFEHTALVIKVTNLDQFPEHRGPLRQAMASVSGILMDGYLERSELDGLFTVCDAYVSLHRSEGFGITAAEAMCLGKPVIATDYAGNTDFMNASNSYPVAYRLIALEQDYGPYKKGEVWADPDLDHAAEQMRRVFADRERALRKGQRAASDIARWYGRQAMARKMVERLEIIASGKTTLSSQKKRP